MNRECFIYVERTRQIWPSTHVGHMSDTGIGKTRLNRVTSAYQEIKKKKKKFWVRPRHVRDTVATCQVCPRHGIAWKKSWFLHLDHYRPSIKLKAFSLSLTLSASLSCFPLGLPSRISLQRRLATNGAPLTSMSPKLHRLVSISLAPSVPESGAWPRFSLLYFLFLFFGFLHLGSLSLSLFFFNKSFGFLSCFLLSLWPVV